MAVELPASEIYPGAHDRGGGWMGEEVRLPEPDVSSFDLVTVLGALADRWRLAAVRALDSVSDPVYCGQLMHEAGFNVAKSTVSHHMRVLREPGVTRTYI